MNNKVALGDCGTCHWFDVIPPEHQDQRQPFKQGWCLYNPPILTQGIQTGVINPGMSRPVLQGLYPPTSENKRCHFWQRIGTFLEGLGGDRL